MAKVFSRHERCYDTRRLQVTLRCKGYLVEHQHLRAAIRRRGVQALQPKAFTPRSTDATPGLRCASNRLHDQPKLTKANQL